MPYSNEDATVTAPAKPTFSAMHTNGHALDNNRVLNSLIQHDHISQEHIQIEQWNQVQSMFRAPISTEIIPSGRQKVQNAADS